MRNLRVAGRMKGIKSKAILEHQLDEGFALKLAQALGMQLVPKRRFKAVGEAAGEAMRFEANVAAL